jgi:hypothetical protein
LLLLLLLLLLAVRSQFCARLGVDSGGCLAGALASYMPSYRYVS